MQIVQASTPQHAATVADLFREYAAGLGVDLCFQNFEQELAALPQPYVPPAGCLLLAHVDGEPAGCVAFCDLGGGSCEMRRLYTRPAYRGHGIGQALIDHLLAAAGAAGYARMRLHTLPGRMDAARALYERAGFHVIPAYTPVPEPGVEYRELDLTLPARRA